MSGFSLDDYVDVAERIRLFYERFPDGRLVSLQHGRYTTEDGREFVYVKAAAFRAPDDPQPCHGYAWEPIPGPTPYTRDSELMNAETAAWGRAIIAAGIPSKKIASADEVKARPPANSEPNVRKVTKAQHGKIGVLIQELKRSDPDEVDWVAYSRTWISEQFGKTSRAELTSDEAGKLIDHLEATLENVQVPFG